MKITLLDEKDMGGITEGTPKRVRAPKEPSTPERMVARAHDAKVNATDDWANGRIDDKEHEKRHKRADKVIACKGRM